MRKHLVVKRSWWTCLFIMAFLLIATSPLLLARMGIVHTKDGKTFEGDVRETEGADSITVTIHGVQTVIPRDEIDSIEYPQSFEQEYKDRAAKLGKNDVQGRLDLARWALDKKGYSQAIEQAAAVLQIDPGNPEATMLIDIVRKQQSLPTVTNTGPKTGSTGATGSGGAGGSQGLAGKFVTAADINQIKQTEWMDTDTTVRVRLEGDVVKKFLASAGVSAADFNKQSNETKGWQILNQGTPEMFKEVRIINDPAPMMDFRTKVQPMIVNGCAAANCHGGPTLRGGFYLHNPADNEAANYTNFYILDTTSNKAGKMIDRTYPDHSLLATYSLPASMTDAPHPEVPKGTPWKGILTSKDDPKYKALINWIGNSLVQHEPRYNINFTLPTAAPPAPNPGATTKPAAAPATMPAPG